MYDKGLSKKNNPAFLFFLLPKNFFHPVAESNLILTETFRVDFFL